MRRANSVRITPTSTTETSTGPSDPVPKILATYPGEKVTPKCRSEDFS